MKSHLPLVSSRRSAFTLIELLVVITIILILAGMAFPVVNGVMERGRRVRTLAVAKDLQVAIKAYQTEYNRYPVTGNAGSDTTTDTQSNTDLMKTLDPDSNDPPPLNPRGIQFIELPPAKSEGEKGYWLETGVVLDEWKRPYYMIIDTSGNNRIVNPDPDSGGGTELPLGVAVYSLGPPRRGEPEGKPSIKTW